ncbi:aldehyde dehydrogenase family protein [Psychroserpens sp.]|uniref:aldehyde dehydrogenase family protein n=1 Tax=Psychroserpens sp. TaxID=2020870 RepID=UPI001B02D5AD|nr:aldehyde dehydrogenase family protein [Psychroserpens sp.]MBO6607806.1 aldehyde dehydrogenase family protein [Psychroserpens sp.]MBO6631524.1 aldehyde dehydrogenase family protein [Psychroserpens sp.]MBO6654797.1 aldehyde dehydrogenase family protein [Psychroserpens sp.]MBO6682779.1 aldehyde dehydrogenase family protein [Psychroserpens sp.]MBO6751164.1 aldehyde dehydrogenase family protein [Psychroserpens sp.]
MTNFSDNRYYELFERQKKNQFRVASTNYKTRIKKLKALRLALEKTYKQDIRDAIYADFKKPKLEVDLTEIYPVIDEINFATKHLKSWLKKQRVDTPIALLGSSSWIKNEPKGVCLIISPWNFPVNLTFGPLVSAIAAGNTVILKPSEMTSHTSKLMKKIIEDLFEEDEVALVEGEVAEAQELLKLPFNHIFFTGSPQVGKIIMKAASDHLASVTLELGGKSPVIIDDSSNLDKAVRKLVFGKFMNSGQTCIAPDYVFINASVKEKFISLFKKEVEAFYTAKPEVSDSFSRIVNQKHFKRLSGYLDDARSSGVEIVSGGAVNENDNYIEPTLVFGSKSDSALMTNEIFGPILPVMLYETIDEVCDYINGNEKPLALYIFSKNKRTINTIVNNTRAGSTCINHNLLQFLNHNLPFGGSNNSGIGKSHGYYGFLEFTNQRSVLKQHTIAAVDLLMPPYNRFKQRMVNATIKWF